MFNLTPAERAQLAWIDEKLKELLAERQKLLAKEQRGKPNA